MHGGLDIGRLVADLDFADDVALVGVSDSEVQENLHRIEALAEAAGLMAEKFTNRDTVANLKQLPHACFPAKYKMFSETSLKT